MKYARIKNSIVQEVIDFDPNGRFHPDVAALFEPVPEGTGQQDIKNADGSWTKYVPPVIPPPDPAIAQRAAILTQLAEIDAKSSSPRALREAALGNTTYLTELDAQAAALRAQL